MYVVGNTMFAQYVPPTTPIWLVTAVRIQGTYSATCATQPIINTISGALARLPSGRGAGPPRRRCQARTQSATSSTRLIMNADIAPK